ncbi:MAG TPA: MamI family restriction endonuclease [Candidatus Bathyarchaeia archaeon]|nr:MamI family restriction endonuclease [Candidatus Bathyarchaeia archaeon]
MKNDSLTKTPIPVDKIDKDQRCKLAIELLEEQVAEARKKLHYWREVTGQPAQVDTGYIAQHLVSIISGILGDRMRGKGDDLVDGSEVKSANFLDSLDKKGRIAPRWNFNSNNKRIMRGYLKVPKIFLVSLDWNSEQRFRAKVWRLDPDVHDVFKARYEEWMEKKGLPKLKDPRRPDANFQLFPPRPGREENYARHGSVRKGELRPIKIYLDKVEGAALIFHAEENREGKVKSLVFNP